MDLERCFCHRFEMLYVRTSTTFFVAVSYIAVVTLHIRALQASVRTYCIVWPLFLWTFLLCINFLLLVALTGSAPIVKYT